MVSLVDVLDVFVGEFVPKAVGSEENSLGLFVDLEDGDFWLGGDVGAVEGFDLVSIASCYFTLFGRSCLGC